MCDLPWGGDDDDDPYANLKITDVKRSDPETEARQKMLWDEAQKLASTSPYTSQYGGPSAIPGMSGMSQAGQQYLTNSILGPDAYGAGWTDPNAPDAGVQNLGFADYQRPDSANQANPWSFTSTSPVVTGGPPPVVPNLGCPEGYEKNGSGECVSKILNPPPAECPNGGQRLPDGSCPPDIDVPPTNQCPQGQHKVNGICVTIDTTVRCGPGEHKVNGVCVPIETPPGPCEQEGYVKNEYGVCVPEADPRNPPTDSCPQGQQRVNGICVKTLPPGGGGGPSGPGPLASPSGTGPMSLMNMPVMRGVQGNMPQMQTQQSSPQFGGPATQSNTYGLTQAQIGRGQRQTQQMSATPQQQQMMQQQEQQQRQQARQSITPQMESQYATLQAQIQKEKAQQRANPAMGQVFRSPEEQELLRTFQLARSTTDIPSGQGYMPGLLGRGATGEPITEGQLSKTVGIGEMELAADATKRLLEQDGPKAPSWSRVGDRTIGTTTVDKAPEVDTTLGFGQATAAAKAAVGAEPEFRFGKTTVGTEPDIAATTIGSPTATTALNEATANTLGEVTALDIADVTNSTIGGPTGVQIHPVTGQATAGVGTVGPSQIAGPGGVTINPFTGQAAETVGTVGPGAIAGPGGLTLDPVTGQTTSAVGGVAPSEFGGSSFLGGPQVSDYMNQAGVEAQVAQARQDYEIALNREKSRQAQVGAFGSRGTVEEAGLIGDQERNIAQIRGAGFDRAAQMMEADVGRRQQAGLQSQQLGFQGGMAGQALEAQRRESDAARAQQAAMQGQQLGFQGQLQTQQLGQAGNIRGAELGLQASMQGQQLEAQRRSEQAARYQQAGLAGQQLQAQSDMQTQQLAQSGDIRGAELGLQAGMQGQQLEAQRRDADAARAQQAMLAGQQLGAQTGMQTQQLQQQVAMQNAENAMAAARANQQTALASGSQEQQLNASRQIEQARLNLSAAQQTQQLGAQTGMQTQELGTQVAIQNAQNSLTASRDNLSAATQRGDRQAQVDAQRQIRDAELNLEAAMQTQQLGASAEMQTQQLGTQVSMQNAQNEIRIAEQNMQSALQTGSQQAQIDAQRQMSQAQMRLDAATRNQGAGLQAAGMGLDAQAQFRQQQMAAAQQLADIGGMQQGATFNAAGQLQQMGAQQERAQMLQQAWDYEQWLRGQQGGAQSLDMMRGMLPGGRQETLERGPDRFGQVLGAATAVGGAYASRGSDVRVKENIAYAGTKNGFNVYDFNYLGSDNRYRGVMAQEIMKQRPDAVESRNGVYWVDYGALGVQMEAV